MAIDPNLANESLKTKTIKEGIKEVGKTKRKSKKYEEAIKQKKIDKEAEIEGKKIDKETEIEQKKIEKEAETAQKKDEGEKKLTKDECNKLQKEKKMELEKKDKELKDYQNLLMKAYVEVQSFKAIEETRRIISKNIMAFVEKKAKYDEAIKNINYDIGEKKKELEPFKKELHDIEAELKSLRDSYRELGLKFEIIVKTMSELKYEHKNDMDPARYSEKYIRKERELKELINDITNKERHFLEKEKERLIKIEEIEVLSIELKKVKKVKSLLENNRDRILDVELHKIGNLQLENKNTEKEEMKEVIDVETIDINHQIER